MLRTTLRSILANKLRLALTAVAILLGTGFVTGSLVLTDTVSQAFDDLFAGVAKGKDVSVRAAAEVEGERAYVPASLLDRVRQVEGVAAAEGAVEGYAQLVGRDGKPITPQGPPTLGETWHSVSSLEAFSIVRGRPPRDGSEIAIDAATARSHHIRVGDDVRVLLAGPPQTFEVVGVAKLGSAESPGGATITFFDLPTGQRLLGDGASFTTIDVHAAPGVDPAKLRRRVAAVLPEGLEARTGAEMADEQASAIQDGLGFFNTAMLAFGGIALFVGAFLISNTFAIVVAQRTRELALLRALGASRRQVLGGVVLEALVVGILASAAGFVFGLAVAAGLAALLEAMGVSLPSADLVIAPRTALVAIGVGTTVTVASALLPARRAGRVAPVAALRADSSVPAASLRVRTTAAVAVTLLGCVTLGAGLAGSNAAVVGLGATITFVGVAVLAPVLTRPAMALLGAPLARLGIAARLGRLNAGRNPRRTAATSAALMVGLGLVAFVLVFASSLKASTQSVVEKAMSADLYVETDGSQLLSATVPDRLRGLRGVEAVAPVWGGRMAGAWRLGADDKSLVAVDSSIVDVANLTVQGGSLAGLDDGGLLVSQREAKKHHWQVGDRVTMTFAKTGRQQVRLDGIIEHNQMWGDYVLSAGAYQANFAQPQPMTVLLATDDAAATRRSVDAALRDLPNVLVRNRDEFLRGQAEQVEQLVNLFTVLLGLAVVIAALGIVNTLALSVVERSREIGLMRAVGMGRRQVARMVRSEAVLVSLFGAMLGMAVGLGFGWALVTALASEGIGTLSVPAGQLAVFVAVAGLIGVAAAVLPARRAARVDVLRAVTVE